MQTILSPYSGGSPDFAAIQAAAARDSRIDLVSVADLLRNAFVYPPHSILRSVKLVTLGFDADHDMHAAPRFRFPFRDADKHDATTPRTEAEWVREYHHKLCDAVTRTTADMHAPWLLQSGGKDSTTLAIAMADVRPETTCLTYLGGPEENELESADAVARKLGLRHESLVCDPGRCYDRYLAAIPRMPLLTADFALLSYIDIATEIAARGGDGIVDGLGSDVYFGTPLTLQRRLLALLSKRARWPRPLLEMPVIGDHFDLCFLLATLQMDPRERGFPGSRFSDADVDELMGMPISSASRVRLRAFEQDLASATSHEELRAMLMSIAESAAAFAKGLYCANATSLSVAYPFCDPQFQQWGFTGLPREQQMDAAHHRNKTLVRAHIATRFDELPYVQKKKGSFRFDVIGLARSRFDQVHASAEEVRDIVPGARDWLERNRGRLGNKFHASRFYLLAVVLPWLAQKRPEASPSPPRAPLRAVPTDVPSPLVSWKWQFTGMPASEPTHFRRPH